MALGPRRTNTEMIATLPKFNIETIKKETILQLDMDSLINLSQFMLEQLGLLLFFICSNFLKMVRDNAGESNYLIQYFQVEYLYLGLPEIVCLYLIFKNYFSRSKPEPAPAIRIYCEGQGGQKLEKVGVIWGGRSYWCNTQGSERHVALVIIEMTTVLCDTTKKRYADVFTVLSNCCYLFLS